MKRVQGYLFIVLVCLFTALSMPSCHFCRKNVPLPVKPVKDTIYPLGFCTDSLDFMEGVLRNGEVFTSLMTRLGMSGKDAYELALSSDSIFNMRKMRAGNRWLHIMMLILLIPGILNILFMRRIRSILLSSIVKILLVPGGSLNL